MRVDEGFRVYLKNVPPELECYKHDDGVHIYDPTAVRSVCLGVEWTMEGLKAALRNMGHES